MIFSGADQPLRVATPAEALDLFDDANKALAWREAHRRTLARLLEAGYAVTDFKGGAYELTRANLGMNQLKQAEPQRL